MNKLKRARKPVTPATAEQLAAAQDPDALVPISVVMSLTNLSAYTIRRMVKAGEFPAPHPLNSRVLRWHMPEVRAWLKKKGEHQAPPL